MSSLDAHLDELVVANRILAHEGVVDGFGHVTSRHPERPDRFFMACSRSPALVTRDDLIEFDLDCNPVDLRGRSMYTERPIHGGVFKSRPDVQAVVHNHAYEVIPYTITKTPLRQVIHTAGGIGSDIPVWDIRQKFGDTDFLVRTMEQGLDLARCLGPRPVALMRSHGCVVAGNSVKDAVRLSVYLMVNARLQSEAMKLGEVSYLTEGEIAKTAEMNAGPKGKDRVWEYWAKRCGMM